MFFETRDGRHVPISLIAEIIPPESSDGIQIADVRLTTGYSVEIGSATYRTLTNLPVASFAAAPGTELLNVYVDGGRKHLGRTPVCGWAVLADGDCLAITPSGINDNLEDDFPVLMPDGSVVARFDRTWECLADFRNAKGITDGVIDLSNIPGFEVLLEQAQDHA